MKNWKDKLWSLFNWVIPESKSKAYIVHLADSSGGLSPVMVLATNRYEADQNAQELERDGVHVVSVEPYFDYAQQ